jgi:penicillin amidase
MATFEHPVAAAFDLPAVEKSGGAGTVNANGATFREIFDLADWDSGLATTAPGQSGQPGSPFYGDSIESWANGDYFPLAFSREAVERVAEHRLVLRPEGGS